MLEGIREDVTRVLCNSELRMPEPVQLPDLPDFLTTHIDPFTGENDAGRLPGAEAMMGALGGGAAAATLPAPGEGDPYAHLGLSRNAPCPCGSGEKYKHCHGVMS